MKVEEAPAEPQKPKFGLGLGLGKGGFSLGKKNQVPDLTDSVKK